MKDLPNVTVVGHPFAPIGRGEDARSAFRSFRSAGIAAPVFDIYKLYKPWREFVEHTAQELSSEINVYYINGDEVEPVFRHLKPLLQKSAYNIVCPAWELSQYPEVWAKQLDRFDEIWAPSKFIFDALQPCVSKPLFHIPLASEVRFESFLGRDYFEIPESSFIFLFAFDFLSSIHRKNPFAVTKAFYKLCKTRSKEDVVLVLKLNHASQRPDEFKELMRTLEDLESNVIIIDKTLNDNEMKNLIRCSDCFISLHRSEGFGRGLAEAMYLEKPTIATGYSGNLDFMNHDNAFLVDYELISVEPDQYPSWENQHWANANVEDAHLHMHKVLDKQQARELGSKASLSMRKGFSYAAVGAAYRERLEAIRVHSK